MAASLKPPLPIVVKTALTGSPVLPAKTSRKDQSGSAQPSPKVVPVDHKEISMLSWVPEHRHENRRAHKQRRGDYGSKAAHDRPKEFHPTSPSERIYQIWWVRASALYKGPGLATRPPGQSAAPISSGTAFGSHTVRIRSNASPEDQPCRATRYSPRKAVTR